MPPPPFQVVLDAHGGEVWRLLVASVGRERAEDCFQETLLAALRAYPSLRHADNLRAWLLTIAHRKALDEHRAAARRPQPAGEPESVVGARASAAAISEQPFELDGVAALLGDLPPKQRAALVLRYVVDLPHAEIGRVLDCSPAAARRNVHDGLARLRARAEEGTLAHG
jgi:RNA polymerase sigma factor (sigma-70 family)